MRFAHKTLFFGERSNFYYTSRSSSQYDEVCSPKIPGSQWQTLNHKLIETRYFDYQGHLTTENNLKVDKT